MRTFAILAALCAASAQDTTAPPTLPSAFKTDVVVMAHYPDNTNAWSAPSDNRRTPAGKCFITDP